MAEENNAFGQFGARSAKFDELLKKYQTIDEGDTVAAPTRVAQPEVVAQPEITVEPSAELAEEPKVEEQNFSFDEAVAAQEIEPEITPAPAAEVETITEPEESEAEYEEPEAEPETNLQADYEKETEEYLEEVIEEDPDEVLEELPEEEPDEVLAELPEEEPEAEPEPEEEPDYSYDIDMFSAGGVSTVPDIDSFDDSWIDSALDDSFFYRPEPVAESAPEQDCVTEISAEPEYVPEAVAEPAEDFVEEPAEDFAIDQITKPEANDFASAQLQSVPVTEYEQEYYITDPVQYNPKVFAAPEQVDPVKDVMAGGYIAPTDFNDFEFDPESGIDFDANDMSAQAPLPKSAKSKKKLAREKKESGKNEMSSVTGFSKKYKASEGKGSKKDGFLVRNFIPKSSDTGLEKARKIIMVVCVLTFVFAGVYLFSDFVVQPIITANRLDKLEQMVGDSNDVVNKDELADKYPDVEFPEGMLEKYSELYAKNQDLAGWIKIDDIGVSLPVVQGEDNRKYLKHDFDGNYNKYGSIFMNCENDAKNLSYNTVLFGHHMTDSKMFGDLDLYKDVEYYKKAPVIEFNTIYGDYKWKIFAVFVTNGTAEGDDGYIFDYTFTDLSSPEEVEKFLGEVNQRAIYKPEVDISVSDKILTLSTCSYEFDEARLVVMARMVRPGESEEVSGKVITNDNPRYPAAYYEKKGLTNPYESAYKWRPS